jgi:methionine synthase II (cobalamin-independent)
MCCDLVMGLNPFLSRKEILIDDAGWGDLILGVVIGALKPPDRRYMERRIPVSSFQPPNFENKKYLDDAVKIVDEIVEVMRADVETRFKVCSGYVLSGICRHLRDRGFDVEEVEITGELQEMVEKSYIRWCIEVGVPAERLEDKRRFWTLLEWVAERPELREKLVKTGWKSWKRKWREKAFQKERALKLGKALPTN